MGTVNYMSPEACRLITTAPASAAMPMTAGQGQAQQLGMGVKQGRPSDVWALGCILYQMVYGHPPFHVSSF